MPSVASIDTYIQRSLQLFESSPSSTKISITYGSNLKKHSKDKVLKSKKSITKSFITFKTFEPTTGVCLKYKTHKAKEFSRLLSLLGPKSIQFNNSSVRSIGSLMSNKEFAEEIRTPADTAIGSGADTKESTPQPTAAVPSATASSSGKKKGKKNKKR